MSGGKRSRGGQSKKRVEEGGVGGRGEEWTRRKDRSEGGNGRGKDAKSEE